MDINTLTLLVGSEAVARAKKRGRAYMCLACYHQKKERCIGELGPMQDHMLRFHVSPDRIPFKCLLCLYQCMTREQMDHHVTHFLKHVTMAKVRSITDHREWEIVSSTPCRITDSDLQKFSQEESLVFFLKKQASVTTAIPRNVSNLVASNSDVLGNSLSEETLRRGYIDPTPVSMAPVQPATATTDTRVGVAQWVEGHASSAFIPIPGPMPEVVHAKTLPMQSGTLEMKTNSTTHLSGSLPLAPVIGMEQSVNTNQLTAELLGPVSHQRNPVIDILASAAADVREDVTLMSMHTPTAATLTGVSQVQPNTLMMPVQPTNPHPSTDTGNAVGGPLDLSPSGARSVQMSPAARTSSQMQVTITPLKTPGGRLMRIAEGIRSTPLQSPANMRSPQLPGHATPNHVVFTANPPPSNLADMAQTLNKPASEPDVREAFLESAATENLSQGNSMAEISGEVETENPIQEADATQIEAPEEEKEENILNQLIGDDATDELLEPTSVTESEGLKRKVELEREVDNTVGAEPERKKHRTEQKEQEFSVSMVALNGLTETLQKLSGHMVNSRKGGEKIEQALIDTTCALAKVTQSLNLLHKQLEMNAEEERKREERWHDRERRREEERTKEREAEQRRTERYRDSEKKERAEIRKLLKEIKGDQEEIPKVEKKKDDKKKEGKENKQEMKSVLARKYTENTVMDYSGKK